MKRVISNYINYRNAILRRFECDQNYYVKPIEEYNWKIKENQGIYFLNYWKGNGRVNQCVIVKKDNIPYVMKEKDYTMIVCIECVKVAIIALNEKEVWYD